jgi:hypothetical protein
MVNEIQGKGDLWSYGNEVLQRINMVEYRNYLTTLCGNFPYQI